MHINSAAKVGDCIYLMGFKYLHVINLLNDETKAIEGIGLSEAKEKEVF